MCRTLLQSCCGHYNKMLGNLCVSQQEQGACKDTDPREDQNSMAR